MKNLINIDFNINTNGIIQLFGNNSSVPDIILQIMYNNSDFEVCYYSKKENKNYEFIFKDIEEAKQKFIDLYNQFEKPIYHSYNNKYLFTYES